jgi:hypothetical protein
MDAWLPDGAICNFAPNLFRAVGKRRRSRSVRDALNNRQWLRDITGAPTAVVLTEYLMLWELLEDIQLQPGVPDRLIWKWSAGGEYSSSSAYRAFFVGRMPLLGAKEIWRASAPPKVKFFFWLALHGRLWTAERRRRHGLQQGAECTLCDQQDETRDHLLSSCVYTREVWHRLLVLVGFQHLSPTTDSTLADWWQQSRMRVPGSFRRGFDSLMLLISWEIWKERNRRTFDNIFRTPIQLLPFIRDEGNSWIMAGFRSLAPLFAAVT